ncbi:hypothetical protein ACO0QE_000248 [Hanseniaspora vineae]
MKVEFKKVHCVCAWSWDIHQTENDLRVDETHEAQQTRQIDNNDEEEDVCGICRVTYNGMCPNCTDPQIPCCLVVGECNHVFHVHCIAKWLKQSSSKGLCPMCRQVFNLNRQLVINKPQLAAFENLNSKKHSVHFLLADGNADLMLD